MESWKPSQSVEKKKNATEKKEISVTFYNKNSIHFTKRKKREKEKHSTKIFGQK